MLENNENRHNGENKEKEYAPSEHTENKKTPKTRNTENIKKYLISIGKVSWRFVKGYLVITNDFCKYKRVNLI